MSKASSSGPQATAVEEGRAMSSDPMQYFFHPSAIAAIGISHTPTKLGYGLARNLLRTSPVPVYLVHPEGGSWEGTPVCRSLEEIGVPVDLAVILVPAQGAAQVLRACGRRGVKAAIVQAGGFRESGVQGAELERELVAVATEHNLRLMGPNCIGVIDTRIPLDTTFLFSGEHRPGGMAFISHSGATCAGVLDWAQREGWGISRLVSLGNAADLTECDALLSLAQDPNTRSIALYLEGIRSGDDFLQVAAQVTRSKPLVAMKVGATPAGSRAAALHTGALAGSDQAYDAAFRRCGVVRAGTFDDLMDWTRCLAEMPLPEGPGLAILTNAGGPGVIAADASQGNHLELSRLSTQSQAGLRALLPAVAGIVNPVDTLASGGSQEIAMCARILLEDPNVNSLVVVIAPPPLVSTEEVARALVSVLHGAPKPSAVCVLGGTMAEPARALLRQAEIPDYPTPERAVGAVGALWTRRKMLDVSGQRPIPWTKARTAGRGGVVEGEPGGMLPAAAALRLVEVCGISTPRWKQVATELEARSAASAIGYPVAVKAALPELVHKSDRGGVCLGIKSARELSGVFREMQTRFGRRGRPIPLLVQRMVEPGQEVIVGALRDPQFGPLVMFGLGGKEVEGLGDVAFAVAPLRPSDVDYLLNHTWAGRRLKGFRDLPAGDRRRVATTLVAVGRLLLAFPELDSIEINPLIVLGRGRGAFAVDVRASLRAST
jgi:acyl-CoA synthetase (NDP forming)